VLVFSECYHGTVDETIVIVGPDGRPTAKPGNVGPLPPLSVEQTMPPPTPTPGMSMTSKLIIGGLVAAAVGGGYYWYSMQPKANPGKKDCGCGCKGGCGG
jgi:glutamate-1-semialdehyde aminotransferase